MVEPINFNKARKAKQRSDKEKTAAENRVKFGQSKTEKIRAKSNRNKHDKHVDDHELDT